MLCNGWRVCHRTELVAAGGTAPVTAAPRFPAWLKWVEEHPGSCGPLQMLRWKAMGCRRG